MDRKAVQEEAKMIMDEFVAALGGIDDSLELGFERAQATRVPGKKKADAKFRESFFANAPNKSKEHIVMEKRQW